MQPKNRSGTVEGMANLFKKATTEMLILHILKNEPKYVYQMVKELNNQSGSSFQVATLHLAVGRLLQNGYINLADTTVINNRERKYYEISDSGIVYLKSLIDEFDELTSVIKKILSFEEKKNG